MRISYICFITVMSGYGKLYSVVFGSRFTRDFAVLTEKAFKSKGNAVVNYLLDLMLAKESLVKEISELSRTFNIKLFSALVITAASFRVLWVTKQHARYRFT